MISVGFPERDQDEPEGVGVTPAKQGGRGLVGHRCVVLVEQQGGQGSINLKITGQQRQMLSGCRADLPRRRPRCVAHFREAIWFGHSMSVPHDYTAALICRIPSGSATCRCARHLTRRASMRKARAVGGYMK
jgi:hypothetical protein